MAFRPRRLGEIAERLGRPVEGDPDLEIRGVAPVDEAGPHDLVFVRSPRFAEALAASRAGAVLTLPDLDVGGRPAIRSPLPDLDFARAVAWLAPPPAPPPGVHGSAVVGEGAEIDPSASVGPQTAIGARVRVGPRSVIHAGAVLYDDVQVGADCILHAGCVVREETVLGDRVVLQPGAVLGSDGFGYTLDEQGAFVNVPQIGRVVVEDDVEIGANTTVDRATLGETRIGRGTKIDNLVQIAHNCRIGEHVIIVAQTGLAGSTEVGARSFLMAQAGVGGHVKIGEGAFLGGRAGVTRDVPPGARVWGFPQMEERTWHRAMAALARLPEALRRLRAVERKLGVDKRPRGDGDRPRTRARREE